MKIKYNELLEMRKIRNSNYDRLKAEIIYHSNKIEGSTFTKEAIERLLNDGIVFGTHTIDDVYETINSFDVFKYEQDTIGQKVNKEYLIHMNEMLFRNTEDEKNGLTGKYKVFMNRIPGAKISLAYPNEVEPAIDELLNKYEGKYMDLQDVARFHARFEHIHPFQNGNGRVGRMLMFKQCIENGIDIILVDEDLDDVYRHSLEAAQFDDNEMYRFINVLEECQKRFDEKKIYTENDRKVLLDWSNGDDDTSL